MSPKRIRFVALNSLLRHRFPLVDNPTQLVTEGAVFVNGAPATNPHARVRADAAIRIRLPRPLRGTIKLAHAVDAFGIDAKGLVALDLGAAAGGFTQALLNAGAYCVYAVDAGTGQLRGWLRAHPKVINLERTNLAQLDHNLVPDSVDLVTMDLSYLAVAAAIRQLDMMLLAPRAELVALVKPTFELHAGALAIDPPQVTAAIAHAARGISETGWEVLGQERSPITGSKGAIEEFLHARRRA